MTQAAARRTEPRARAASVAARPPPSPPPSLLAAPAQSARRAAPAQAQRWRAATGGRPATAPRHPALPLRAPAAAGGGPRGCSGQRPAGGPATWPCAPAHQDARSARTCGWAWAANRGAKSRLLPCLQMPSAWQCLRVAVLHSLRLSCMLLRLAFPLQAKKVQELVVAIIRQFTEAYGPLILVLGAHAGHDGQGGRGCWVAWGLWRRTQAAWSRGCNLQGPSALASKAQAALHAESLPLTTTEARAHPCPPQRTCTTLTPPASACCPAPSTTSRCAAPSCSSSPTGAPVWVSWWAGCSHRMLCMRCARPAA